jgi:hypothetical protein
MLIVLTPVLLAVIVSVLTVMVLSVSDRYEAGVSKVAVYAQASEYKF